MNKTFTNSFLGIAIIVALAVTVLGLMSFNARIAGASAPSGLISTIASSSIPMTVGTTSIVTLFTATNACTSRVISTVGSPIMLAFSTSSSAALRNPPSATYGHLQSASTTVVYDSGLYGCPEVTVYGYAPSTSVASTTITTSEFR